MYKVIKLDIFKFLQDKEKINFLSTTKENNILKDNVFFNDMYNIDDIINSKYFDRYINILSNQINILPNSITHLTFSWKFNQNISKGLLSNLKYLKLHESYKYKKHIPSDIKIIIY